VPEGAYEISDEVTAVYERSTIDAIEVAEKRANVLGKLLGARGEID
jgi:hypothetical protein